MEELVWENEKVHSSCLVRFWFFSSTAALEAASSLRLVQAQLVIVPQ